MMKIYIFVIFITGCLLCSVSAANETEVKHSSSDNVTSSVNVTESDDQLDKSKVDLDEADDVKDNVTVTTVTPSLSNVTVENFNQTANETEHEESEKTEKRHAVYLNTGYVDARPAQVVEAAVDVPYHNRGYADTIPGVEGVDYPIFSAVPPTAFSCNGRSVGLYGDVDARCQVWHNCQVDGKKDSFLCPNGTLFNQQVLVCDWYYNVDCPSTPSYYGINAQLAQQSAAYYSQPQQLSRYQHSSGQFYNYQSPYYVQTTTYPTQYYIDTGNSAAYTSSAGNRGSFVSSTGLNGGNGAGYYYRPSYYTASGAATGLGGYGYTVSTHSPGYNAIRYDNGQSQSSNAAGRFQYSFSSGPLPTSYNVPQLNQAASAAVLNQASSYVQRQRVSSSGRDPIDHPNYNEKSGYNYRPPQIPLPTPITYRVPTPAVETLTVVQPQISRPPQPIRVVRPPTPSIDHPNANEKSSTRAQRVNYSFSSYQAQQQPTVAPVDYRDVYEKPTPTVQKTNYAFSTYQSQQQPTAAPIDHPNYNEKSSTTAQKVNYAFSSYQNQAQSAGQSSYASRVELAPVATSGQTASKNFNYQFSTYNQNQVPQYPSIAQGVTTAGAAGGRVSYSSAAATADVSHPNAHEKSGYSGRPSQTTNYAFSSYGSNGQSGVQPVLVPPQRVPKPTVRPPTYVYSTHSTYNQLHPPVVVATNRPPSVDPIDHPNYNEKSGYNPRPYPEAPLPAGDIRLAPPRVQVDCTGYTTCRPASPTLHLAVDTENIHSNFGQRVEQESAVLANGASGSVAASDRSAGPIQNGY